MQAIIQDRYGSPDLLQLRDIQRPAVGDGEVLVRVRAAAVHVGDCFGVRGTPFLMRMATGLWKPKYGVPGYDFAGHVEAVGKDVTRFQVGDQVFGECNGACAEFTCTAADRLAAKPNRLSFQQAAAVPTSALAALHALRDVGKVQAGQKVLINGAAGGVGTYAVQIAKSMGAEVTGVCGTGNVELVRGLGADHVIDYQHEDFAAGGPRFDLIFDNIENRSLTDCRRALTPSGMLILNSGTGATGIGLLVRVIKPLLLSPFVRHTLRRYLSVPNHDDLVALAEMIEAGTLTPVIDRTYRLAETPDAIRYLERGHARGKVVIDVNS